MVPSSGDEIDVTAQAENTGWLCWLRKRDGRVVRFEPAKLAKSIQRAARSIGLDLTQPAAAELARVTIYFLEKHCTAEIPSHDDVAEWVQKCLHETGQESIAAAYGRHRERCQWARQALVVVRRGAAPVQPPEYWEKSRIAASLRADTKLDPSVAADLAATVERSVLASGLTQVTTDLLRAWVNNELTTRGLSERLAPPRQIELSTVELQELLRSPVDPPTLGRTVARKVWQSFMLSEVFSSEIAEAHARGLLRLQHLGAPAQLAATAIDTGSHARRSEGPIDAVCRISRQLAGHVASTVGLVALDAPDATLACLDPGGETAENIAAELWQEVVSRVRNTDCRCVLNLYGRVPQQVSAGLGAGPLFPSGPKPEQMRFAAQIADHLLGLVRRDAQDVRQVRVDWHWRAASGSPLTEDQIDAPTRRALRMAVDGHAVSLVCDRGIPPLGDGLSGTRPTAALQFISLSLPACWRGRGTPASTDAVLDAITSAAPILVRAGLQKREFVRRHLAGVDAALVDRAALVVGPAGLDWIVRHILGRGMAENESATSFAGQLVRQLRSALEREARAFSLPIRIDCWSSDTLVDSLESGHGDEYLVGLSPWAPAAGMRQQIAAAGRVHAAAGGGTLLCPLSESSSPTTEKLANLMQWAAEHSDLTRVRWIPRQATGTANERWFGP